MHDLVTFAESFFYIFSLFPWVKLLHTPTTSANMTVSTVIIENAFLPY